MTRKLTLAAFCLLSWNTASATFVIFTDTIEFLGVVEGTCNISIDELEPWSHLTGACTLEKIDPQGGPNTVITPSGMGDIDGFSLEWPRTALITLEVMWLQSNDYEKDDSICTMFRDITLEHWLDNTQDDNLAGFFGNCIIMANDPPVQSQPDISCSSQSLGANNYQISWLVTNGMPVDTVHFERSLGSGWWVPYSTSPDVCIAAPGCSDFRMVAENIAGSSGYCYTFTSCDDGGEFEF